ncbi:MAG: hypothetical protein ABIL76_00235 [candidate division WOR-3 bacterium]
MLKPLLLLLITNASFDSLEIQIIDINSAKYEELNSIPFFTDEDIQKILKQRPYHSFNEFAESLNLSSIEREILRNYIFISKKEKKFINFIISFNYDSTLNYKLRANLKYREFSLKFSESYFLLGYQNFYFGNFYISKGLGLISKVYFKNNINNGIYFYNNLALLFKFKNFEVFFDTLRNYLLSYNFRNSFISILGNEKPSFVISNNLSVFSFEILLSKHLNYAYGINLKNDFIYLKLIFRKLLDTSWNYSNTSEKFSIYLKFKNYPITISSNFSNTYQYHSINYKITDGSNLEFRISEYYYKIQFENEEGLKISIFRDNAIKIGYKFISIYQYRNLNSICDEYKPLFGCNVQLNENENYQLAIDFKYKFIRLFLTNKQQFLSFRYVQKF